MKTVTVDYDPATEITTVETEGFSGTGCKAVHEAFDAMGKVTKEVIKPEFYKNNSNQNTVGNSR